MARVRTVVFDLDGTLYDARRLRRRMLLALASSYGLRPWALGDLRTLQTFRRCRERLADDEVPAIGSAQYTEPARALGCPPRRVQGLVEEWIHRRPLPLLRRYRFSGVGELFAALRASGRRIAVWSDYPAATKLAALGLEADLVVSAEDPAIDRLKPHPAGLAEILARLNVDPEACLMVGDRDERDGEAARRLGVRYRLKTHQTSSASEFESYDELLAAFRQR